MQKIGAGLPGMCNSDGAFFVLAICVVILRAAHASASTMLGFESGLQLMAYTMLLRELRNFELSLRLVR